MRKIKLLLLAFIPLLLNGTTLSREDVISRAAEYANHSWVVNRTNPNYRIYSTSGADILGVAYSYGDKVTIPTFDSEISEGKIPRNWQTNFNDSTQALYTGIDCSGLVTRSLDFGNLVYWVNANGLAEYTIAVIGESEEGDIWWSTGHVFLQGFGSSVLEANPYNNPGGGQRVQIWEGRFAGYGIRSIFPQFSNESPDHGELVELDKGETTVDISLTLRASGDINTSGVRMFIQKDGEIKEYIGDATLEDAEDNTWMFTKEDFDVSEGGNFTVFIIARNDIAGNGYKDEYEWEFTVDPAPPIVRSTDPAKDSRDVPVDKSPIAITFSKPMDQEVTANAVSVNPSFTYTTSWPDEKTLNLELTEMLDYCKDYTITIPDAATDTSGVRLDGNNDGDPGDPYIFTFTTEPPDIKLAINPEVANVEERHPLKVDFITDGSGLKKEFDCNIDFNVHNSGSWSVTEISEPSFSLPAGGTHPDNFTVRNRGAAAPLRVTAQLPVDCDIIYREGFYWTAQGHLGDHPDENQSPGDMQYPTPWLTRTHKIKNWRYKCLEK